MGIIFERRRGNRKTGSLLRLCLYELSKALCTKSPQHGCLNMIRTRTKPVNMLTWMGEHAKDLNLRQRTTGNQGKLTVGEMKNAPICYPIPKWSVLQTYSYRWHLMDWAGWSYIFKEKEDMNLKDIVGGYTEGFGLKRRKRKMN